MTKDELTALYHEANGLVPNALAALTTERIFKAMEAAYEKGREQDRQDAEKALDVLLAWMQKRYDNDQGLDWVDQDARDAGMHKAQRERRDESRNRHCSDLHDRPNPLLRPCNS